MRKLNPVSVAIPLLCLAALSWSSPASAQNVPFKVYITELWQLDESVDPGIGLIGDYYAKVTINGVEINNRGACDDTTTTGILVPLQLFKNFSAISQCNGFPTPWVFKMNVPANQPVHVKIEIWDSDLAFDDHGDARPGDGDDVDLVVDPSTGIWTSTFSGFNWPNDCSRPHLDLGGNNVNVCWQVGFDTDDDGLLDVWETAGVDTDNDGVIDINLPALGANPFRKDVFVQAGFLQASNHTHAPLAASINRIVTSFANAPVSNPDGTTGIQLHVDVGPLYGANSIISVAGPGGVIGTYGDLGAGSGAIAEAGNEIIEAFSDALGSATKFDDLKAAHFDPVRETIFRYAIFGHQTNNRKAVNDCTSGIASQTRREFLVTLGGVDKDGKPCWSTDAGGFSVGNISEQGGTFMHEMGHTLGLGHGGFDVTNNKPNYLSVMNYSFQDCDVPASPGLLPGGCDYSRLVSGLLLPPLDEIDLDECVGIGGGLGFGKVDWNMNGMFEGVSHCGPIFANVTADVNNDGVCVKPGPNKTLDTAEAPDDQKKEDGINDGVNRSCDTAVISMGPLATDDQQATAQGSTPPQPNPLNSFDDWGGLKLSLIDLNINWVFTGQEPDSETLKEARRFLSETMAPNVTLDETGPATAKPGDVLTYAVQVENTGRGPALSAVLHETNTDGSPKTIDVGIIAVGSQVTDTTQFMVPANACPGDFSGGASASISFKDFVGNELTAADSVPLQVLDVSPPTVAISMSPAILWPPDHKFQDVTATITVTDNCDHNPKVTLLSITSNEPATGFLGQGDDGPDIGGAAFGTDDRTFSLRSERGTGKGSTGRVYTITYRVTDTSGNATVKSAIVTVPTSNSGK